jgi:hypothetical protein
MRFVQGPTLYPEQGFYILLKLSRIDLNWEKGNMFWHKLVPKGPPAPAGSALGSQRGLPTSALHNPLLHHSAHSCWVPWSPTWPSDVCFHPGMNTQWGRAMGSEWGIKNCLPNTEHHRTCVSLMSSPLPCLTCSNSFPGSVTLVSPTVPSYQPWSFLSSPQHPQHSSDHSPIPVTFNLSSPTSMWEPWQVSSSPPLCGPHGWFHYLCCGFPSAAHLPPVYTGTDRTPGKITGE